MRQVLSKLSLYGLLFLCFLSQEASAQITLSAQAEIVVVTIGPYQGEVWSAFGHSGIRIYDPAKRMDWFYDYGVFDFEQESFFLNFAKGLLKYKIGVREYQHFLKVQKYYNRSITEQYLNLTLKEKQEIFDYLQNNARPENAEYLYNYVYDNCATKIKDVLEAVHPGKIKFDLSYKTEGKTIRDLMDDYLDLQPWGEFGINLGLGTQIDKEATAEEYMFLPDYVFKAFEGAVIDRDTLQLSLVAKTVNAFVPQKDEKENGFLTPLNTFIILFFVIGFITNRNFKTGKRTKWLDTLLFAVVGFAGCWVAFLWIGTEHLSKWNLNILWAIPFHLPLAFFINKERFRGFMKSYFKVVAIGYCILLVVWALLPQPLGMALVPLVLAMILRAFYISYDLGKIKNGN
jgi:hypothetical protein